MVVSVFEMSVNIVGKRTKMPRSLERGVVLIVNPFPSKPWFLRVCNRNLLKTRWEKEKLLVTSNFSFPHSVFYLIGELSAIFIKLKKLPSANSFNLDESKICRLGKG